MIGMITVGDADVDKIHIKNERLWEIAEAGEDIDGWLKENVGHENYTEWVGITNVPWRTFSFKDEEMRTLFILRWL
jgi:hypothetical protein